MESKKYKVVKYFDTYPDGIVMTTDIKLDAEKECSRLNDKVKNKPLTEYIVRRGME